MNLTVSTTLGVSTAAFTARTANVHSVQSIVRMSLKTPITNVMSKSIPIECYEATAREEGWLPSGEIRAADMITLDRAVVESIVFHQEPAFFNVEQGEPASASSWQELCEQQQIRIFGSSWRIPTDLPEEVKALAREFRLFVSDHCDGAHMTYDIGSVFRDPTSQGKFENVRAPSSAVMAVIFDGGPVASMLNLAYGNYKLYDAASEFFKARGYWFEHYAHWWAWIHKD